MTTQQPMTPQRVYVSHPIAGKSEAEKRSHEAVASTFVREVMGGEPVLPRTIAPGCGLEPDGEFYICGIPGRVIQGDKHTVQCYMRGDLTELLQCDRILMMPGWQFSAGCRDELTLAMMTGIPITFYEDPSYVSDSIRASRLQ